MYETIFLALTPLDDETSLDTKGHFEMVEFVLSEIFRKTLSKCVALIGDNISTKKAVATLLRFGFVDCASHQFNLAVKQLVSDYRSVVHSIHSVMIKLRFLTVSAKLRQFTSLKFIRYYLTRWSSTFLC